MSTLTDTPAPTSSPTPSSTPTPSFYRTYLPVTVRNGCLYHNDALDLVLILDMSSSMRQTTTTGQLKYALAIAASTALIEWLDPGNPASASHQVAIAAFNSEAWIQAPLTRDPTLLRTALAALPERITEQTRLDLGLIRAHEVIAASPRRSINRPIAILLSDGMPNRVPPAEDGRMETTVIRAADALKSAGTEVHVVGIGTTSDVYHALMRRVASQPEGYQFVVNAGTLAEVFTAIGRNAVCR